jgi:UDP-N-acetylglucosamine 2-epimerase (non-hydrolysing)
MNNSKLKLMTVVGTRPEIIRLSRVMSLADKFFNHIVVHTGQNYDYELNEIFFKELGIRKPDHFLNVDTSSLGKTVGGIMQKSEEVMLAEKPDALLVLGDTNSCLSAYMAKRMHIPIYHMEAGNRCYDFNVPEEINRRVIDHISDFNLVYTEHARRHLISEGLPQRRIYLTGSPMYEVLMHYKPQIESADSVEKLKLQPHKYFVVSVHREENVDNPENLKTILEVLNTIADTYQYPVIVSTHPRTRKRIEALQGFGTNKLIQFMKPFGFNDYVNLQLNAACTISDSGTISEESSILSFPAITIRNSMERPEAIDAGVIILTGFDKQTVINSVNLVIEEKKMGIEPKIPAEYCIDNTSWRVVKLILGTTKLSNKWHGVTRGE